MNGGDEELGTVVAGGCAESQSLGLSRASLVRVWKHPCGTRAEWSQPTPAPLVCDIGEESWLGEEAQKTQGSHLIPFK